jgi:hypothetical protein
MNNYYNWVTSVNVQNTSSGTAYINMYYYNTDGSLRASYTDRSIPPYSTRTYYSPQEGLPPNFIGTLKVTSASPIVAIVNQSYPSSGTPTRGQSYSGIHSGSAYVALPNILNFWGSDQWISSVSVQNIGNSSTTITLTFPNEAPWTSPTIPANGYQLFYTPNQWGSNSKNGPATITTSNNQPVVVIANIASNNQTNVDLAHSYNGYNR